MTSPLKISTELARDDPWIGMAVDPTATVIAFDDGSQYECEDGVVIRQVRPPIEEED